MALIRKRLPVSRMPGNSHGSRALDVLLGHQIVNRRVQIGDGGKVPRPALLLCSLQAGPLPGHGTMVQVVRRDELAGPIQALLVEDLLIEASHERLVLFG